jgi:hypothetical protein
MTFLTGTPVRKTHFLITFPNMSQNVFYTKIRCRKFFFLSIGNDISYLNPGKENTLPITFPNMSQNVFYTKIRCRKFFFLSIGNDISYLNPGKENTLPIPISKHVPKCFFSRNYRVFSIRRIYIAQEGFPYTAALYREKFIFKEPLLLIYIDARNHVIRFQAFGRLTSYRKMDQPIVFSIEF